MKKLNELEDQIIGSIDTGCGREILIGWFVDGDHPSSFGEDLDFGNREDLASRDRLEISATIDVMILREVVIQKGGMLFVNWKKLDE